MLWGLIKSLQKTTTNLDNLEMLVAIDQDDGASISQIAYWPSWVHAYVRPRTYNFSRDYYNQLVKLARFDYVQAINDDTEFETHGWDEKVHETLKNEPVALGRMDDFYGHPYTCFPLLTRKAIELQGWFFPEWSPVWSADIVVNDIWSAMNLVFDIPYMVKHISHHTNLRPADDLTARCERISKYHFSKIPAEVERIKEKLK